MRLPALLDLIVVGLASLAALHGWHSRGTRIAGRWTGLLLGAAAGVAAAGWWLSGSPGHPLVAAGIVVVALLLGAGVGAHVGQALGGVLRRIGLGGLDRLAGAVVCAALAVIACCLVLDVVAVAGPGRWATAAGQTGTAQLGERLRPQPVQVIGAVVDHTGKWTGLDRLPALLGGSAGTAR